MNKQQLDALDALHRAATEAPWVVCRETAEFGTIGMPVAQSYTDDRLVVGHRHDWGECRPPKDDLALIAAARNALPALLAIAREHEQIRDILCDVDTGDEDPKIFRVVDIAKFAAQELQTRDEKLASLRTAHDIAETYARTFQSIESLVCTEEGDGIIEQVESLKCRLGAAQRDLAAAREEVEALQSVVRNTVYPTLSGDVYVAYVMWQEDANVRVRMPDAASLEALDRALDIPPTPGAPR